MTLLQEEEQPTGQRQQIINWQDLTTEQKSRMLVSFVERDEGLGHFRFSF
jgi:hypothetical protein